jgi:hypothetical protein
MKRLAPLLAALLMTGTALAQTATEPKFNSVIASVTPVVDTSAYASGDLLVETTEIPLATRNFLPGRALLTDLVVIDKDDEKAPIDIYIMSANVSAGTRNAAPSISDANAVNVQCIVSIAAADYKDLGGVSVATGKPSTNTCYSQSLSTSQSMYFFVVNGTSTQTYTAAGDLVINFKFAQD